MRGVQVDDGDISEHLWTRPKLSYLLANGLWLSSHCSEMAIHAELHA